MSMKDELIDLLRDRFTGHELEVPHTVWENVSGQLAASATGEGLREALQDKFQAHEVDVDPSAWSNISSQLGHGAAAGTSFGTAWIAAGIAAIAITAGVMLWNTRETPAPVVVTPVETVNQQPVASLSTGPTNPQEPIVASVAVPTKSEHTPTIKATHKSVAPVVLKQQPVQQPPLSVKAEAKDAPLTDVRSSTSGNATVDPVKQPPTPQPQSTAVQTPKTEPVGADTGISKNAVSTADSDPEQSTTQSVTNQTSPAPQGMNGNDPFTKTDAFNMFFPNTFTPNGDGDNDEFGVIVGPHLNALIQIFSMNGSLVFQTNDLSQWWNGHLPNGNIAEEGSYTCIVQVTDLDGQAHLKKKVISLYRTLNP
ncbi:MAG: gliding motility-associated C-terminal domain-containing protein [Flavobacteriales bacterium]